jgi:hypothetical protein
MVTIQGQVAQLNNQLPILKGLLLTHFDTVIEYGNYVPVDSDNILASVQIEETEINLKRMGSSGEFYEKEFDELSFHTDTSEQVRKMGETFFQAMIRASSSFGRTTRLISSAKKEHITVKYQNETRILEVSTILNLDLLMVAISKKFSNPTIPLKCILLNKIDDAILVTDITDLIDKETYYVLNVNEELPKKAKGIFKYNFSSI